MNPQDQQLDPSVVALTKAIGQSESGGNYNTPSGDKGSQPSAYQFTPGFIKKWAPVAGINYQEGKPLDPASQDKLAYTAVQTMGTKGDPGYAHLGKLSPAQIVSAWNAGDPNAYLDPEYGKNNAYGSTANYVSEVQKNYEKNFPQAKPDVQGSNTSNPDAIKPSTSSLSNILLGGGAALGTWILGHAKSIGGDVIKGGGAALGGELGGPGGAIAGEKIGENVANDLGLGSQTPQPQEQPQNAPQQDNTDELMKLEQESAPAMQASKQLHDSQIQALSGTIGGRNLVNDPQMKAGILANAKYGLAPEIDENGSMNWEPAKQKSFELVGNLSKGIQRALISEGTTVPLQETISRAKEELRRTTPSVDWEEGDKDIESAAKQYEKNYGNGKGEIHLGHLQQMKQETGHGKKWGILESSVKKRAYKALSTGARQTIEEHTKNPDLYNRVMKEEQDIINGRAVMKRLNGKKAPKNESVIKDVLHSSGKYAALYIGDKIGGPIGAILGSMVGEHIIRKVDKKFGKTIFETPSMHAALDVLNDTEPKIYKFLISRLKQEGIVVPNKEITDSESDKKEPKIKRVDALVNKIRKTKGLIKMNKMPPFLRSNPYVKHKVRPSPLQSGVIHKKKSKSK